MIPSMPLLKPSLIVLSLGVHCAALYLLFAVPKVEIEGGSGNSIEARLGNSFEDLAAEVTQSTEPEIVMATEPSATEVKEVQPAKPIPEVAAVPEATVPLVSPATIQPTLENAPEANTVEVVTPIESLAPREEQIDVLKPVDETPSERPKSRPQRTPQPLPKPTERSSNSTQSQTAGDAAGKPTASAARRSTGARQSSEAGNAAASNYPGKVMRKISRIRKPRANISGTTVVRFAIADSGALQSARIVQSSGSKRFDQAVLQVVRRAAPFPPPPRGGKRNFSVKFSGQN